MKKFATVILLVIMVLCCTACSGKQSGEVSLSGNSSSSSSTSSVTVSSSEHSAVSTSGGTTFSQTQSSELQSTKQSSETHSSDITTTTESSKNSVAKETKSSASVEVVPPENQNTEPTETQDEKILVVYFSATGTTKTLAKYAADILNADIYEIVPQEPYTEEDLAYYTGGRADQEQNDPSARPEISGSVENMEQYDTILLGYPIWHGQAPRIISTFLESYDFSDKTILPFCTSHSSGIGSSDTNLHSLAPNANWLNGERFAGGTSKETITVWLNEKLD